MPHAVPVGDERFIANAEKLVRAYKKNPSAHHYKERARAQAGLLKHLEEWEERHFPRSFCDHKGPLPNKYGATLADLRDFQLKPIEALDLSELIDITKEFLKTVARSRTLMLRADGVEGEEAIKALNEYVSQVELPYVRCAVFDRLVSRYWTSKETLIAWASVELQAHTEIETVLYLALAPGKMEAERRIIGTNLQKLRREAGLSQDTAAAALGISKTTLIAHEKGRTGMHHATRKAYADYFMKKLGRAITVPDLLKPFAIETQPKLNQNPTKTE